MAAQEKQDFQPTANPVSSWRWVSSLTVPTFFPLIVLAFITLLIFSRELVFGNSSNKFAIGHIDATAAAAGGGGGQAQPAAVTAHDVEVPETDPPWPSPADSVPPIATLVVDCHGGPGSNFTAVGDAIAAVATMRAQGLLNGRVLIFLKKGIYKEKIVIPRDVHNITLQGSSAYEVTLTYDDMAARPASEGTGNKEDGSIGTLRSASVTVQGHGFIARDITFENSYTFIPGEDAQQAVAYCVEGDMAAHYNCRFLGMQDTLYDRRGRHYFYNCYIEGAMDFIFGEEGQSIYEKCTVFAKRSGYAPSIAAHKRQTASAPFGFVFLHSRVLGEENNKVALGRAWGDHSRVVYAHCHIGDIVDPNNPWDDWGVPSRQHSVFYAEYENTGPGATATPRNQWTLILTRDQAQPFLTLDFIDGAKWLPPTLPSRSGQDVDHGTWLLE